MAFSGGAITSKVIVALDMVPSWTLGELDFRPTVPASQHTFVMKGKWHRMFTAYEYINPRPQYLNDWKISLVAVHRCPSLPESHDSHKLAHSRLCAAQALTGHWKALES